MVGNSFKLRVQSLAFVFIVQQTKQNHAIVVWAYAASPINQPITIKVEEG